ncbi:hypothetical protein PRZ48_009828 [Zasmidium cellare]|uniref:AB hydrolase-1 domain-containing protein n=1 Tax=Zasmidium cellare TaxID=395010 RepID=A0ABR0EDE9_ZASCE|nr:hypothetical protein PRZ48_009828 [Zasmidium cellare]
MGAPASIRDEDIDIRLPQENDCGFSNASLQLHAKLAALEGKVMIAAYGINGAIDSAFINGIQDVLSTMVKIADDFQGDLSIDLHPPYRLSRVAATLHVEYYQCTIIAIRPIIFVLLKQRLAPFLNPTVVAKAVSEPVKALVETCVGAASKVIKILQLLHEQDLLEPFLSLDLAAAFSAGFILALACFAYPRAAIDLQCISQAEEILSWMASQGNVPAKSRRAELMELQAGIRKLNGDLSSRQKHGSSNTSPHTSGWLWDALNIDVTQNSPFDVDLTFDESIMAGVPEDLQGHQWFWAQSEVDDHQCIANLSAVLKAAGSGIDDVAKVNVYLLNMEDFDAMNEVYKQYWGQDKPARTLIMAATRTSGTPPPMLIDGLKGEFVSVNGIRMFFMHGGNNKRRPLVLVHGLFQTGMMWRRVAPKLMENHYLIVPDNRGYGQSEKPDRMEQMTKKLQAQDLHDLLLHLGIRRCVMLSHDRGARIARTFAMDYPEMLLGVTFMDMLPTEYIYQEMTCTQTGSHHWDQLFKLASPMAEELLCNNIANTTTYVNNFYERTPRFIDILKQDGVYDYYMQCITAPGAIMAMLNDYRAAYHIDVPRIRAALERGERINVPVQLLWGSKGNASKSPIMDIYRARCSNSIEGAVVQSGHYLAEEEPKATQDLLLKFCDKCFNDQTSQARL